MAEVTIPTLEGFRRRTRPYDQPDSNLNEVIAALTMIAPPTGSLMPTLSSVDPGGGWKICDGQALAKADFPSLYAVLGDTFGSTSTTFNLPDLRGRAIIGAGGGANIAFRATGGAHEVTLSTNEMPAHTHAVTDPGHGHTFTPTPHSHAITDPGHSHTDETTGSLGVTAGADADAAAYDVAGDSSTELTGIGMDTASAGGSIGSTTTGIAINPIGGGQPFQIIPPAMGANWLIKT